MRSHGGSRFLQSTCLRRMAGLLALFTIAAVPQTQAQTQAQTQSQQTAQPASLAGVWKWQGFSDGQGNVIRAQRPQSQWSTAELPFTTKGKELFFANKPSKGPRGIDQTLSNDFLLKANPPGLYRAMIYDRIFQFVQQSDQVTQLFEWNKSWRAIYTDNRPVPKEVAAGPYWYGYSVGKWQGNTLVIDTLALDERAWLDEWGTPIGPDTRIQERWTRIAPDKMQMTFTVTDAELYAKPWTSTPALFVLQKKGVEPQEILTAPMDVAEFNDIRGISPAK